jgi:hypothetical protein
MQERLVTFACALGALLLFGSVFLRGDTLAARLAAPPTSVERGHNGLLGVASWLREEGVRTVSLRERFGSLARRRELAASGNLLLVVDTRWQHAAGARGVARSARVGAVSLRDEQRSEAAHRAHTGAGARERQPLGSAGACAVGTRRSSPQRAGRAARA